MYTPRQNTSSTKPFTTATPVIVMTSAGVAARSSGINRVAIAPVGGHSRSATPRIAGRPKRGLASRNSRWMPFLPSHANDRLAHAVQ